MAIEIAELVAEVTARTTEFKEGMSEVEHGMSKTSKVAGVAGLAIAGGLAYGFDKSIEAAEEGQQSTAHMDAAFKAAHVSVDEWSKGIEDAEGKSRKLGFTNDESRDSLSRLVVATHSGKQAIADLSVAEDIARNKHESLDTATGTLAKAMTGSARAAKELGITIIPATDHVDALGAKTKYASLAQYEAAKQAAYLADKQETAKNVIDQVTRATSGQAEAFSHTAAGGMAEFHAQTNEIEEQMGNALLPALTKVTAGIAAMAGWMAEHEGITKIAVAVLGALAAALLVAAAAQWAMNSALLASPITWVVVAIVALVAAIVYAYEHFKTFHDIVVTAFNGVRDAAQATSAFIAAAWHTLSADATAIWGKIGGDVKAAWSLIKTIVATDLGIIKTVVEGDLRVVETIVRTAFNVVKDIVKIAVALIHGDWSGAWNAMKALVSTVLSGVTGIIRAEIGVVEGVMRKVGEALLPGVEAGGKKLLGYVESIPGRIVAALGDLGHLLEHAGEQVVAGLVGGIESKISGLAGAVGHLKSLIHLTDGTPAGDEEDRRLLYGAGQLAVDGLVAGIASKLPDVSGALASVKGAVAVDAPVGAASIGRGGGTTTVQVNNPTFLSGNRQEMRLFAQQLQEFLA